MFTLIIIALGSNSISTHSIQFSSESLCLKAISKIVEVENFNVKIKARCVRTSE